MMILTGKTVVSAVRPPYPYGGEFVNQFMFTLRLCWMPLLVSTVAVSYGAPGLQAANFLILFGALDRLGGFFVLATIREFAPFVCAIIVAGVAGTAITADLGARKIREELDALQVLGVDPVKNLVVPRFLALMICTGLFDAFAIIFGITGGVIATLVNGAPLGPFLGDVLHQRDVDRPLGVGAEVHDVRGDHRRRVLLQGDDGIGWRRGGGARGQPGRRHHVPRRVRVQLRLHPDAARDPPRDHGDPDERCAIASFGDLSKFCGRVVGQVYSLRVFRFFGEALRQAGILIISSTLVIWGLVFIIGLQCGIEGAYFTRAQGAPAYAGVFSAWCDLRELVPYAFGYMMSAKVGTGIVAELGSMRISDEIDALEVMGIDSVLFLCATRLLAAWMVLPFMYMAAIGSGFFASYLAVVQQVGEVSSGGFFLIFWMFQNPPDFVFSVVKAMAMATLIVLVGCYFGYHASGGPVGVGSATAKSMVVNIVGRAPRGHGRDAAVLGRQPAGSDRRMRTALDIRVADEAAARRDLRAQIAALEAAGGRAPAAGRPAAAIARGARGGSRQSRGGTGGRGGARRVRARAARTDAGRSARTSLGARAARCPGPTGLRRRYVVRPRLGLIGMLAGWWEVKLSSGCP